MKPYLSVCLSIHISLPDLSFFLLFLFLVRKAFEVEESENEEIVEKVKTKIRYTAQKFSATVVIKGQKQS